MWPHLTVFSHNSSAVHLKFKSSFVILYYKREEQGVGKQLLKVFVFFGVYLVSKGNAQLQIIRRV